MCATAQLSRARRCSPVCPTGTAWARACMRACHLRRRTFLLLPAAACPPTCYCLPATAVKVAKASAVHGKRPGEITPAYDIDFIVNKKYKWSSIDYLKMDIEGAEKLLFEKEEQYGKWLPKVKCMSIELHDRWVGWVGWSGGNAGVGGGGVMPPPRM